MELNKAIEILESIRNSIWVSFGDCRNKKILSEEEQESIDTILTELDKLRKAKEEMTAEEFLRIRDMECIKYVECDDKCKFKRGGECVALCRIAVQIAKEIKEENNEQI